MSRKRLEDDELDDEDIESDSRDSDYQAEGEDNNVVVNQFEVSCVFSFVCSVCLGF
jgi:hypothetical protein